MTTYDFITANKRKTALLIAGFSVFIVLVGWFIDQSYDTGGFFVVIALVYSVISALGGYYAGDKVALAVSGARAVTETTQPYVVRMVQNLSIAAGMPMPKVYVIDDEAINAFATGRDPQHASIAVTTGAIQKLENEELEGVLAHELSHVRNYDIRVMTIVIVLVGIVSVLADLFLRASFFGGGRRRGGDRDGGSGILAIVGIVFIVLSPIFAYLIQLAVSRKREYLADASGALLTRFPEGLARALKKIELENRRMRQPSNATAHLFIANPFNAKSVGALFSTHPPLESRIRALEQMGGAAAF